MARTSSRDKIIEAFAALIAEKPIEQISVKEVYNSAGVNKSTFYYHFRSIEELQETLLEQFLENWKSRNSLFNVAESIGVGVNEPLILAAKQSYSYFFEHKDVFSALMRSSLRLELCDRLAALTQEMQSHYSILVKKDDGYVALPRDTRRLFLYGSSWELVGWLQFLVDSGFEYSLDEFVEMAVTAISVGELRLSRR